MTASADFTGTAAVRAAHRFDEARLAQWMQASVAGYAGPLAVEQFRGGQSNPTYKLMTPERSYVLRRKPPGELLRGAHAVEREAEGLRALGPTGFPVPQLLGLCTDDSVLGTWFYVMEYVDGRVYWDGALPQIDRRDRPLYYDAMNETIARLHQIDPASVGLAGYGRPGNYFARQIARWSRQYLEDPEAGRHAAMDRLVEWLPANVPAGDETVLVHGDYRMDNLIFHPTEPRVIAVLDWELSTLGHPLADFCNHVMMYHLPPGTISSLGGADLQALNVPDEATYVAAYCRRTGRDHIADLGFYVTFSLFRMAAIFHGIQGRVLRGTAASARAVDMAASWTVLAEYAWRHAGGSRLA